MNIAIILDWTMAIMLIISITYSWRLNKKIMDFRNNKGEFFQLIKILDDTIIRAETSIEELKRMSLVTSNSLGTKLDTAKIVIDDLAFMSDRSSSLITKLETSIKNAKKYENNYKNVPPVNNDYRPYISNNFTTHKPNSIIEENSNLAKSQEPKAAAIESLLAKISALKSKKETIDS